MHRDELMKADLFSEVLLVRRCSVAAARAGYAGVDCESLFGPSVDAEEHCDRHAAIYLLTICPANRCTVESWIIRLVSLRHQGGNRRARRTCYFPNVFCNLLLDFVGHRQLAAPIQNSEIASVCGWRNT